MCLNMHMRKISSVVYLTSIDDKIIKNVYKSILFFPEHEYSLPRPEYHAINRHFHNRTSNYFLKNQEFEIVELPFKGDSYISPAHDLAEIL